MIPGLEHYKNQDKFPTKDLKKIVNHVFDEEEEKEELHGQREFEKGLLNGTNLLKKLSKKEMLLGHEKFHNDLILATGIIAIYLYLNERARQKKEIGFIRMSDSLF